MFSHVVCGGTFDRFHVGHKTLLQKCFEIGKKVTIGVTSQEMALQKLKSERIQSWSTRRNSVYRYLASIGKKAEIVKLHDIYGPTVLDCSIDAIVVTSETKTGADMINNKRLKIGMKPLSIILVDMQKGTDKHIISSTRIRKGLINRGGNSYLKLLFSRKLFILPKSLIPLLRMPLGRSFRSVTEFLFTIRQKSHELASPNGDTLWITVGDVVTYEFQKAGFLPQFSVIDKKTLRKALKQEYLQKIIQKDCLYALNEKGTISSHAIIMLNQIINLEHKRAIKQLIINGEEDLLVLPVVLLLPLGAYVFYGVKDKGIVAIMVTEKVKEKVYNLLKLFD